MSRDRRAHCPICGEAYYRGPHRCDPEKLERIERARKGHEAMGREQSRSYGQRLAEGFEFAEMAGDDDGEDE